MSSSGEAKDPLLAARVPEEFKRKTEIRARQLGMNTTEYLINLVEDDLSKVDYLDDIDFE